MKAAICIPTHNEADSIAASTIAIDAGLQNVNGISDAVIVNADNGSPDGTSQIFLNTSTKSRKTHIDTANRGKGRNLVGFWIYCLENEVDVGLTIDADVVSIEADWPEKMLTPILEGSAEYVMPQYERSRFEGSTTNHFAFPIVYGLLGANVRQPIGGSSPSPAT